MAWRGFLMWLFFGAGVGTYLAIIVPRKLYPSAFWALLVPVIIAACYLVKGARLL